MDIGLSLCVQPTADKVRRHSEDKCLKQGKPEPGNFMYNDISQNVDICLSFLWILQVLCGWKVKFWVSMWTPHWPAGRRCWAAGTSQTSSWADRGCRERGQQPGRSWAGPAVSGSGASPPASVGNACTWYHSRAGGQLPAGLPGTPGPREWWQQWAVFGSPSPWESCRSHSAYISRKGGWYLAQKSTQKRRWRGPQQWGRGPSSQEITVWACSQRLAKMTGCPYPQAGSWDGGQAPLSAV